MTDPDFFRNDDDEAPRKIVGSRTRKRLVNVWYPTKSPNDAPFLFAFRGLGSALYFLRGTRVDTYGRQFTKLSKNGRTDC